MPSDTIIRLVADRVVKKTLAASDVRQAVGEVHKGCELFGISRGTWSMVDLVRHVLDHTGKATLDLCTWTAGRSEADEAWELLKDGRIERVRLMIDSSFAARQPAYLEAWKERFGPDAIRLSRTHAKFCLIANDLWDITILSSMNLNRNPRIEFWQISDNKPLRSWLSEIVDALFREQTAAETFTRTPTEHGEAFESQWATTGEPDQPPPKPQFFSVEPFGNDLRRTGLFFDTGRAL